MACETIHGFYRRHLTELFNNPPNIGDAMGRIALLTPAIVGRWDRERCQQNVLPRYLLPVSHGEPAAIGYLGAYFQISKSFFAVQREIWYLSISASSALSIWNIVDSTYLLKEAAEAIWRHVCSTKSPDDEVWYITDEDFSLISAYINGKNGSPIEATWGAKVSIHMIFKALYLKDSINVFDRTTIFGRY